MKHIIRLLSPIQHIRPLFLTIVGQAVFHSLLLIAGTDVMKRIIDMIESGSMENIPTLIIILIGLVILYIANQYFVNQKTLNLLGPVANGVILKEYMQKFFTLDANYVETLGTGKLINSIERGTEARFFALVEIARPFTVRFGRLIFSVIYVFTLDGIYGRGVLIAIVTLLIMHVTMQNRANKSRRQRKNVHIQMSRTLVRHIQSKNEIVQSQKTDQEIDRYAGYTKELAVANTGVMQYKFYGDTVSKFLIDGIKVLAILSVVYGFFGGYISLAVFVTLITILGLLDMSIYQMSRLYISLTGYFIHIEKMRQIFDDAPETVQHDEGIGFAPQQGDITLNNLSFQYEADPIFETFSLTIKGCQKTALVGESGSGKSTLIKLIAGYLRPNTGSICVDGQDLAEVSLKSYYQHIGYLTQEPSVFDGTILDNLTYAINGTVDQEVLNQAIALAKCEFIYDFPQGLDTEIGERGIRLSGGQRQRLAIAKIFLKDPAIILLDEPTSALDSFSEEAITQAMHNLFENRTVIIIAHRLQTVKHADDIIVIEQGSVIERGTHTELVEQGGSYAKMLELQSGF